MRRKRPKRLHRLHASSKIGNWQQIDWRSRITDEFYYSSLDAPLPYYPLELDSAPARFNNILDRYLPSFKFLK